MESPSKIDRRQAWARSSRRKLTLREGTPAADAGDPLPHLSLQDDVFMEGCSAGKIETWLQGCGNDVGQARNSHLMIGPVRTGISFEDDLSLGAEATALYNALDGNRFSSTPKQKLNLPLLNMGQSIASSALSNATSRTVSSVSEVLQMRAEDAEDTLFQLGFGCEELQVTSRIPVRFFNFPSHLRGINFRLFLESQLARIHQEDPCLSLASRFRQVEALTAMANAFYSLYSHVSRTPLQKLAPPELTLSSPLAERAGSRTSVRSEPRSPVERLKDTISKMCLYTGSRGSDSASPSTSPRKRKGSQSGVTGNDPATLWNADDPFTMVDLQIEDGSEFDKDWFVEVGKNLEETVKAEKVIEAVSSQSLTLEYSEDKVNNAMRTSLEHTAINNQEVKSKGSACLKSKSVTMEPVPLITHDVICPKVIEYVNQAPYRSLETNKTDVKDSPFAQPSIRWSNTITSPDDQAGAAHHNQTDDLSSRHTDASQKSLCQITVTGWEGDVAKPDEDAQEPCSSNIQKYLRPVKPLNQSRLIQCPTKGNSFELEEVNSADEEEAPSSEFSPTVTLSISTPHHKSSPLRGDSFQSDSSGFAEEDVPQRTVKCDVTKVTSHAQGISASSTA
ncbi:protein ITPRID2 isoform X1 [Triplophysa dalaica]|uniref:protein ITPRID2 isoform X1 n=1 Tax=Triplophysa dalaica TaxID=1582913 RepID=UPI0024DFDCCD|nr:protein ITPRID2 isoform X1 [Triplophysa dalaica]